MWGVKLESVQCVEDLGAKVASSLWLSCTALHTCSKHEQMCYITWKFSFKNKDVIFQMYNSFVRPHLENIRYRLVSPSRNWHWHWVKYTGNRGDFFPCAENLTTKASHPWSSFILRNVAFEELTECVKLFRGFTNVHKSKLNWFWSMARIERETTAQNFSVKEWIIPPFFASPTL